MAKSCGDLRAGLLRQEIIDRAASTGGYDKETVQDVMLGAVENAGRQAIESLKRHREQRFSLARLARNAGVSPGC